MRDPRGSVAGARYAPERRPRSGDGLLRRTLNGGFISTWSATPGAKPAAAKAAAGAATSRQTRADARGERRCARHSRAASATKPGSISTSVTASPRRGAPAPVRPRRHRRRDRPPARRRARRRRRQQDGIVADAMTARGCRRSAGRRAPRPRLTPRRLSGHRGAARGQSRRPQKPARGLVWSSPTRIRRGKMPIEPSSTLMF